jgi:hypothetical protein
MKISFSPVRMDGTLTVIKAGDRMTVNRRVFDFSVIPDGATLPADAIDSDWFAGSVERIDGELHLTLILPHGSDAPEHIRFPQPLENVQDGIVPIPAEEAANGEH